MIDDKQLGDYYIGNEILRGIDENGNKYAVRLVKLNIPYDWDLLNAIEEERFSITPSRTRENPEICSLYGAGDIDLSTIYEFALKIIQHNHEKIEKVELFNKLVKDLQYTFSTNDLETVKRITFEIKPKKVKSTKQITSKKVEVE